MILEIRDAHNIIATNNHAIYIYQDNGTTTGRPSNIERVSLGL